MKKIYLLLCTLIFSATVNAQTKTFTGAHGSQWGDANNWEPLGFPNDQDMVIIDNHMTVYLDRPATVKCIALYNGASLVTQKPLVIQVESATFPQAIFLGSGAKLEVANTLDIGGGATANIPTGININYTNASVLISNGGRVSIDRCQTGVFINGNLSVGAGGSLKMGQQAPVTGKGILMDFGNIVNYGTILIDNVQGPALATDIGSLIGYRSITNGGTLQIGNIGTVAGAGITTTDAVINNSGNIIIDDATNGIQLTRGSLSSTGNVVIGSTTAVMGSGIVTSGTAISNSLYMSIKSAQADGMQLTGGTFTNTGALHVGLNANVTGNCGGIGIHTNGTVINSSNYIDFGGITGNGMQLENGSSLTNSGNIYGGGIFGGFPSVHTDIHGNLLVLDHSSFVNTATGEYYAYNSIGYNVNGVILNNSSHIENRGTLRIMGPRSTTLLLDGNSDFRNYGYLESYYGLSRSLNVAGGSLFENNTGGSVHLGGTLLTSPLSIAYITGNGSSLSNMGEMLINGGANHGIELTQNGSLLNSGAGVIKMDHVQQNGIEITGNGRITNNADIELNEITNIPLHVSGGNLSVNSGSFSIGNSTANNSRTGILIEGANTKLQNNTGGQITIDKIAAGYNDVQITTGGAFQNNSGGLITVLNASQNGIEVNSQGQVTNSGTLELNEIANYPLHGSGAAMITNNGMIKVGNGTTNSRTGVFIEGTDTRFENNAAGQITINKTAAGYNGALVTTGAVFQNDGKITWGTSSAAFQGSAALQLLNNGVFDNRLPSSTLEFVNCTNDGIVCDLSSTGSSLFLSGLLRFGNIGGRGIYNSDPNYGIASGGRFETMTGGKMNLQVGVFLGSTGSLINTDGTVTLGLGFSNNGAITNNNVLTQSSTFFNNGPVVNNGTWNNAGIFSNNTNGVCKGSGTFQGNLFKNNLGTVAPGNSPGCLAIATGYNQSTGTLDIEVNGKTTACTQFDRLNVTGTATLSGALKVTFGGGYTGAIGDAITILKSTSLNGTFSSNNLPPGWSVLYNSPATGDVTIIRAIVPLTLLDFNVQKEGEKAKAFWTTTSEVNTAYFELERSKTGSGFERIATIPAANTPGDHHYEFTDAFSAAGKNYYRLRMVDVDGQYTYSPVVSLNMGKAGTVISAIYPNPVKDIVHIAVAGNSNDLSIQIVSLDGKTVMNKQLTTAGIHDLNVSALPAGVYFIKTNNGEAYKLIKQ
jgi:hypothetical protein